jgi:hypothetical protein
LSFLAGGRSLSVMLRAQLTVVASLVGSLFGAGCQPQSQPDPQPDVGKPDAARADETHPRVGRLAFQDHTVELTLDAFGTGPNAVDPGSYARVVADVNLDAKQREPGIKLLPQDPRDSARP